MQVVFDDDCLLHDPLYETLSGFRVPYYESPARYRAIRSALERSEKETPLFSFLKADSSIDTSSHILNVHSSDYFEYLKNAYTEWIDDGGSEVQSRILSQMFWAHTLQIRTVSFQTFLHQRLTTPKDMSILRPIAKAGYYCFDLSTPITAGCLTQRETFANYTGTFKSSTAAVQITLTAARQLITSRKQAVENRPYGVFALNRPPGHHAGQSICGGYCYFNNVAIAARYLQNQSFTSNGSLATIVILDIDYHHGNGTQELFYEDPGVFYISIHASHDYPYFTGFSEERGSGNGLGYNLNIPLPRGITGDVEYCNALLGVISRIRDYDPTFLLVSLGVDTFKDDPISDFKLTTNGYSRIGEAISTIRKPTLFVMEGGYHLPTIGENVRAVLEGFIDG